MRIPCARAASAALGMFGSLALRAMAGTPSERNSLFEQVAAEERQVVGLEHRVDALLRMPAPIAPAGKTPVPLYLGGGSELPPLGERSRLGARHLMLVEIERGGVTEVDYDDGTQVTRFAPPWEKQGFVVAPVEVLFGIRMAAMTEMRGVELDLRVTSEARGVHFVTLVHELDGPLRVTDIAATTLSAEAPRAAPSDAELRRRFGIGRLDGGAEGWSAAERQSLERALGILSDRELAQIRGVELRRESAPRRVLPIKGACGLTTLERGELRIEMYDRAFHGDDILFVGSPRAPERESVRLILHEIGHAIAMAPIRDFVRDLQRLSADGQRTSDEYVGFRAQASDADRRILEPPLSKTAERMRAVAKRLAEARPPGPAVAAFSHVPGAASGITRYGRTSPSEAFAEAFSLFHADPDALRRVSPEALAFFQRGGHLAAEK